MAKNNKNRCSFCGRTEDQVEMFLGTNSAFLCVECAMTISNHVREYFGEELPAKSKKKKSALPEQGKGLPKSPRDIKTFLDDYVIGQDDAKKFQIGRAHV